MAGKKGRSGRRPLPNAVKALKGTLRNCRVKDNEIRFPISKLSPPEHLNERAREEWERIVPLLDDVKILTDPDLAALAGYCSAVALSVEATIAYQTEGLMAPITRGSKMRRVNPMIRVAKEARAEALRYAIEFGLTPAARSRVVGQPPKKEKDSDDEFMFHPPKLVVNG